MSNAIPAWLKASPLHISAVLHTLASRELARESARRVSRQRSGQYHHLTSTPKNQVSASAREHYSVSVGSTPRNQINHRYLDLEPYDRTLVLVGHWDGYKADNSGDDENDGGVRYINANWVRELYGGKWWIATQAPLPHTAHVFLSLLLQPITTPPAHLQADSPAISTRKSKIRTVVQLTQQVEHGRRKAHSYFPSTVGQAYIVPPEQGYSAPALKVTLLDSRIVTEARCVLSTVSILPVSRHSSRTEEENEPVVFRHLLFKAWPDHGVPQREDRICLLEFIRLVDRTNKDLSFASAHQTTHDNLDLDPDPPIMINCSAGVGRTGAFIALSSLLRAYDGLSTTPAIASTVPTTLPKLPSSPLGPLLDSIKDDLVAQEIDSLREQRPWMVQRDEQTIMIYELLAVAFTR